MSPRPLKPRAGKRAVRPPQPRTRRKAGPGPEALALAYARSPRRHLLTLSVLFMFICAGSMAWLNFKPDPRPAYVYAALVALGFGAWAAWGRVGAGKVGRHE